MKVGDGALGELNTGMAGGASVAHRTRARRGRLTRHNTPPETVTFTGRKIPAYNLLSEAALSRIEDQADWILREIGVEFQGDAAALELLAAAGAKVDGKRVRFKTGHARALCATAPRRIPAARSRPGKNRDAWR